MTYAALRWSSQLTSNLRRQPSPTGRFEDQVIPPAGRDNHGIAQRANCSCNEAFRAGDRVPTMVMFDAFAGWDWLCSRWLGSHDGERTRYARTTQGMGEPTRLDWRFGGGVMSATV